MKLYRPSEISVFMDDQTQLLFFLGKEHCGIHSLGRRMQFSLYSTKLYRQFLKIIKKQRRKNMFSLIQP